MKKIILSVGTVALATLIGCRIGITDGAATYEPTPTPVIEDVVTTTPTLVTEIEEVEEIVEAEPTTFRVTAYCACSKCCGEWAFNRPTDSNGVPMVYGAYGELLTPHVSCASPLPFGTEIELEGLGTVVVEDKTASWVVDKYGENIIDIYFDNHQEALNFGCRYVEGVILNGDSA